MWIGCRLVKAFGLWATSSEQRGWTFRAHLQALPKLCATLSLTNLPLYSPTFARGTQPAAPEPSPSDPARAEQPQQFHPMFRRASGLLARSLFLSSSRSWVRPFSTDLPAAPTADSTFVEAWKKVVPNIEPPKTPIAFVKPRPSIPSSIPSKLTVNFVLPYASELSTKEVDMVIIPATTGQMGVLPGHVATIAELKPGVLSVHEGNEVTKYFISSGFAFIHANSYADVVAIEAVPIDQIDPTLVQKGLAEFTQKLSSASTDLEKAEAQIGVDMHSALNSALTG